MNDLLIEAQNHLENLKKCAFLEEKQREEIITKKIDDSKQINQLRNAFLKLKEYLQKTKRFIRKRVLTHEEKSLLTEESIPVASLETYLLTFSKKKKQHNES